MQSGTLLFSLRDLLTMLVDVRVLGLHLRVQLHRVRPELLPSRRSLQELLCDHQLHQLRKRKRLQGMQARLLCQRCLYLH